eukprot:3188728-Rhodomonas_salina.1
MDLAAKIDLLPYIVRCVKIECVLPVRPGSHPCMYTAREPRALACEIQDATLELLPFRVCGLPVKAVMPDVE